MPKASPIICCAAAWLAVPVAVEDEPAPIGAVGGGAMC